MPCPSPTPGTYSQLMSIESVIPSNCLIFCHPLLLSPSIFPSIRVLSNESILQVRWPKYWSFSFSISPPNEYSGLISFRMDWLAMATHSSTLAWKIPWMEEPGGLQSMGSLRVGHDWATSLSLFTFMHWRRKWQPTPVFLPGESQGRGSLVGYSPRGCKESDTTERLHFHFSFSCIGEGNGNPTPVFLPGESQGQRSLVGCRLWGRRESDTTEAT